MSKAICFKRKSVATAILLLSGCACTYGQGPQGADTLSFYLPNIVVTAIESQVLGTASFLPASTFRHTSPATLTDLMQLVPGGLTTDRGIYFACREISFKEGINRVGRSLAQGMRIVVDGSPLHTNAGIGGPYDGEDTRFISLNEMEQAEIVRGIPSAQYGNLTNGMVILKTRSGQAPFTASIRYNPSIKQYNAGKGFQISPLGHTLNLLADYSTQGRFHSGGLRLANRYHWLPGGKPLHMSVSYTARFGKENQSISDDEQTRQSRQDHRFSLQSDWQPEARWLHTLSFRLDGSTTRTAERRHRVNTVHDALYTTIRSGGEWQANFLPTNYAYDLTTENRPLYVESEIIASSFLPLSHPGYRLELKTGVSWRSEGNRGEGVRHENGLPPSSSLRERDYRDTPFLHYATGFAEALFQSPRLNIQAGLRYQGMKSRDYDWLGSLEPRVNLSWVAYSAPGYTLRVKGGAGLMGLLPSLGLLYPEPVYNDIVSFYYRDTNPGGHSLGVITVQTPGEIRSHGLRPTVNRKIELGLAWETPLVNLDITAFFERQDKGFSSTQQYLPFTYRKYDYLPQTGLHPEYRDGQVWTGDKAVPYTQINTFTAMPVATNTRWRQKRGIELVANFGTFTPLLTSVVVDGMWLRIRERENNLWGYRTTQEVNGRPSPYVGFYDRPYNQSGNESQSEIVSTNFRFITRIPRIGLVTTLTWQMVWLDKDRNRYNGGADEAVWPLYWCGPDGIRHPFTEKEKADPAFAALLSTVPPERFLQNSYKPYGLLNFRASKGFRAHVTLAFFVNNLADIRPLRLEASSNNYKQQNPSPFFGLEMQVSL